MQTLELTDDEILYLRIAVVAWLQEGGFAPVGYEMPELESIPEAVDRSIVSKLGLGDIVDRYKLLR